jgi:hypothetical protein
MGNGLHQTLRESEGKLRLMDLIWNPGSHERSCRVRCPQRSKSKIHFILR